ncbi:multiple sugar transport system permease protein [Kribbella sp. VKM Ac-2527]|uniref:Multiple sugar transport system permease protein n=1 Tax=Kribbella caucasensis TaxID=2512215 RepID=A0A4R6KBG1_9ACTN|nr:sugar ABC transporter permease [Kribbella sp. VKM Ac-2527]TDO44951.1 multiple sugar transport system permease protein [Kribbella sp. VKM Ac-2527]
MATTTAPRSKPLVKAGTPGEKQKRSLTRKQREAVAAYAFLAPDVIGLLVFVALPMVLAFAVALFKVDGFGNYQYVGLANYKLMGSDDQLLASLKVTGTYVITYVPIAFVVSLALAMLVRNKFKGIGWVRSAFFLPNVVSLVVVGLLWQFLLVDKRGAISSLLAPFGLEDVSFLGTPSLALGTYVVISVWFIMGYQMLVFLAGLKDVPKELEDAAHIDGAGSWQRFRYVIWPLLRPTSFFVVVNSTIGAVTGLQAFDLVYVLTAGGPARSTSTVVLYIYEQAFTFNNIGYATALTTVVVALLVICTGLMFALTRGGRFDEE